MLGWNLSLINVLLLLVFIIIINIISSLRLLAPHGLRTLRVRTPAFVPRLGEINL